MRFGFIGFGPLHVVPLFILSPLPISFLFFSFMSSLASCPVSSSLSFFCVHTARPLVCTCTTYFQIRFQVCPVLSSSCLHSFVFCAHAHTFARTLVLLASPRGGVCVCVPLVVTGIPLSCFYLLQQGALGACMRREPTKTLMQCLCKRTCLVHLGAL